MDPVGLSRAQTQAELHQFFADTLASSMRLKRQVLYRIIISDEALETCSLEISMAGQRAVSLSHIIHSAYRILSIMYSTKML